MILQSIDTYILNEHTICMKTNYLTLRLTYRTFGRSVLPVRVLYKCGLPRIKIKS